MIATETVPAAPAHEARLSEPQARLSEPQARLLAAARDLAKVSDHSMLVSGPRYRTALSLERKGLGTVRYQGPSMGWFRAAPEATCPACGQSSTNGKFCARPACLTYGSGACAPGPSTRA